MTTAIRTKGRRTVSKSRKPARTAEGVLPMHGENNDKLDFKAVLVEALSVPGKLSNAYSLFYRYSFLNMLLVFMQTGRIEPMGTFKFWTEKMGRMSLTWERRRCKSVTRLSMTPFWTAPTPNYRSGSTVAWRGC